MSGDFKFRAVDAFVYVDTYRRQILHPASRIQSDLRRINDQLMHPAANLSPTRLYAELRAYEHALNFVVKREEPGMVVLGETDDDVAQAQVNLNNNDGKPLRSAKQLANDLRICEEHSETLDVSLRQAKTRESELLDEIREREHRIERINRRMANSQSTLTVLSVTLGVTVLALLLSVFF